MAVAEKVEKHMTRKRATQPYRCPWAKGDEYVQYHDREWGVPVHDDRLLFEFLILEGAQAGLSWATILKKRDNYRKVFDQFEPARVARYGKKKQASLLGNTGIRSEPTQNRFSHQQRKGISCRAGRVRQVRRLHLEFCRWRAYAKLLEVAQ